MRTYRLFDRILSSSIPLPELPIADGASTDFEFLLQPAHSGERPGAAWFHHWKDGRGAAWMSVARLTDEYLLRFHTQADFHVSNDGRRISCTPIPSIPHETLRHLLLDQVMPVVLGHQGQLVLHASSVETTHGAIVFLGATGQGKSTVSAGLAQAGFPLLADDCLLLRRERTDWLSVPSYVGLRLWDDVATRLFDPATDAVPVSHYSQKKRLRLTDGLLPFRTQPLRVCRAYVLDSPSGMAGEPEVLVTRLTSGEAFGAFCSSAFRLDITDRARLRVQFDQLGHLAAAIPTRRLAFPRTLSIFNAIRRAILADLESDTHSISPWRRADVPLEHRDAPAYHHLEG